MTKSYLPDRPLWFYMFFALGLFVTLNTYIGAQGHGNAQIPLLLYLIILGSIIAKYHIFRWRSPSIVIFSLLILYGAVGSFVARFAGQELSYFTGMALGIIVASLHFLPKSAAIDFSLIKKFLYYSGLLFVVSRIARIIIADFIEVPDKALFLTHEVSFLLVFVVLIPLFEKKWLVAFLGFGLSTLFLMLDFRTTTFLIYVLIMLSSMIFMADPLRDSFKKIYHIGIFALPAIVLFVLFLLDDLIAIVKALDLYFRGLLQRPDTQSFRENLNQLAIDQIAQNPWLGELFQGSSVSVQHFYYGAWRVDSVHNVFLALGVQGGLLFLLPFVLLIGTMIITASRMAARHWTLHGEAARMLAVLVVALLGAVVSGLVNPFLGYAMGAFWFWTIVMLIYLVQSQVARAQPITKGRSRGGYLALDLHAVDSTNRSV